MKQINKSVIALLSASFLFAACSDKLDIPQHGVLDSSNFYLTDEDAASAVAGVYSALGGGSAGLFSFEMTYDYLNGYLADEYWQGENQYAPDLDAFASYSFDTNNPFFLYHYQNVYSIIGQCNQVIDNVKGETPFQKQVIAEARVVRAWMHFELATLWGNPPMMDHVMSADEPAPGNADPEALWAFMETDLSEAVSGGSLTQKASVNDRTNFRITKQYAQALLGKVYLWEGKNEEAAKVLDEVIESGLYDRYRGEYGEMYAMENENGPESMFETNRVLDNPNTPTSMLPPGFGICGYTRYYLQGENQFNLLSVSWGGFSPRGSLYQAFIDEEGADSYRLNQSIKTYQYMADAGYTIAAGAMEFSEGHFQWKGRYTKDQFDPDLQLPIHRNIRWMRFAEVLLMAAEANIGIDQTKADKYLGEVRSRVGLPAKACTLEAIQTERRLELFGDFCRYKDLQRWGIAKDYLTLPEGKQPTVSGDGTVEWKNYVTDYGYKEGKHRYLPFPHAEIIANKNIRQHDGWND